MFKRKKSKINKMEKLRHILDNFNDPIIKKSISKDDKIFESVYRRLLAESLISKVNTPSELLVKKSYNGETSIDGYIKEEKIAISKQFETTEQAGNVEGEFSEEDHFDGEDIYEVEKVDVSTAEFLEVEPKEVDKESITKKIISEESSSIEKKDKMMIFQEIIDKIQMYRPIAIIEMWVFTLTIGVVSISGLFLLRDWLFLNFGVYGNKFIPTLEGIQNVHIWFGFAFVIFGLFHFVFHIYTKEKDILPKQTLRDFKTFLHSGMYLIGFARKEDYGTSERFYGRQRIVYSALVYILGLTSLTGMFHYMNFLSDNLTMVHVIPAGLSIMVLLFHFLITIRKHDIIALKSAFITGTLPLWYIRKNHPIWFEKMRGDRESKLKGLSDSITVKTNKTLIEGGSNLTNAVLKFALLLNDYPDSENIEAISEELQNTLPPDRLDRIIELAHELNDEVKEESKN